MKKSILFLLAIITLLTTTALANASMIPNVEYKPPGSRTFALPAPTTSFSVTWNAPYDFGYIIYGHRVDGSNAKFWGGAKSFDTKYFQTDEPVNSLWITSRHFQAATPIPASLILLGSGLLGLGVFRKRSFFRRQYGKV